MDCLTENKHFMCLCCLSFPSKTFNNTCMQTTVLHWTNRLGLHCMQYTGDFIGPGRYCRHSFEQRANFVYQEFKLNPVWKRSTLELNLYVSSCRGWPEYQGGHLLTLVLTCQTRWLLRGGANTQVQTYHMGGTAGLTGKTGNEKGKKKTGLRKTWR